MASTTKIEGGEKLKAFLELLAKQKARVDVGFFPKSKYADGTPVAEVAIYNEFGTFTKDGKRHIIPPRPFLHPTYEMNRKKWTQVLKKSILKQGENISVKKALDDVGFVAQKDVQASIDTWAASGIPRNAQSTQDKKGFDSPLIETGHMRESVEYEVING